MLYEVITVLLLIYLKVDALPTCKSTKVAVAVVKHAEQKLNFTLHHSEFQSLRPDKLIIGEASFSLKLLYQIVYLKLIHLLMHQSLKRFMWKCHELCCIKSYPSRVSVQKVWSVTSDKPVLAKVLHKWSILKHVDSNVIKHLLTGHFVHATAWTKWPNEREITSLVIRCQIFKCLHSLHPYLSEIKMIVQTDHSDHPTVSHCLKIWVFFHSLWPQIVELTSSWSDSCQFSQYF